MSTSTRSDPGAPRLGSGARERLRGRVENAAKLARQRPDGVLAAVTVPFDPGVDVAASALGARRGDEPCFCWEQPDRAGLALATVGEAITARAEGVERFAAVQGTVRRLSAGALVDDPADDPSRPAHAGPLWCGGFAFAHSGGSAPEWSAFAPAQLVLPEALLAREGDLARLTLCALVSADDAPAVVVERLERRAASLVPAVMPMLDPDPVRQPEVHGAAPASHYEGAVARAVESIARGQLEKVVLAREVRVHAPARIDPAPVFDGLRRAFPACYSYLVAADGATLLGASPELLVRREGARAQTVALAGTARRSADPSVDVHLGEQLRNSPKERAEQAIVARRIERCLEPVSVWVAIADEPALVAVQNVQHLATPIRAQLIEPLSVLELVERLHPTPAVGGEPRAEALELIPRLEGLDRGWYAGAVGYSDLSEDGEFCVAIRCALLRDRVAHLYAGCGIVGGSDPSEELAESEVKLQALLPLLT